MLIGMIVFIIIAMGLAITLAISLVTSYHKGYDFGNSLSEETMDRFKKISDENVKLKERDVVLSDVAIRYFALVRKQIIENPKEELESMEEYDEKAKLEAFGEYGDMFKDKIEELNNTEGQDEFDPKKNTK